MHFPLELRDMPGGTRLGAQSFERGAQVEEAFLVGFRALQDLLQQERLVQGEGDLRDEDRVVRGDVGLRLVGSGNECMA